MVRVLTHTQQMGEICMIRKIECMVATFNGEADLEAQYCEACTDDTKAKTVQVRSNVPSKCVFHQTLH